MSAKYEVQQSTKMIRDVRRMQRRGKNMAKLWRIVDILAEGQPLSPALRDHVLWGDRAGQRECHIEPDWFLIYEVHESELVLMAMETGTHSELYKKK